MNRTQAFLLPPIPLEVGVPIIDRTGRRGVVVDKWFCRESLANKVRVCRIHVYNREVAIDTSPALEVRVDLTSDLGLVFALREYLKIVNAAAKEDIKPYVWTWGGLHEQVVKWLSNSTDSGDEQALIDKLISITNTEEN